TPEGRQHSVFLPSEVVVDEGEDATLPCRSITAGQRVKSAQWKRDGEVVLGLNPPHVTDGNDFESRVSIPSDWHQRGDLSLSIKRVQLRDRGVYFCDVDKTERYRSAVRLRVRETVSKSPTSTLKPTLMVSTLTLRTLTWSLTQLSCVGGRFTTPLIVPPADASGMWHPSRAWPAILRPNGACSLLATATPTPPYTYTHGKNPRQTLNLVLAPQVWMQPQNHVREI
uniref:Ig-like domain-containing protein n=1 Tax=Oreochromis aureus TaxID=47969 RepID=A0A668S249_OREAU